MGPPGDAGPPGAPGAGGRQGTAGPPRPAGPGVPPGGIAGLRILTGEKTATCNANEVLVSIVCSAGRADGANCSEGEASGLCLRTCAPCRCDCGQVDRALPRLNGGAPNRTGIVIERRSLALTQI